MKFTEKMLHYIDLICYNRGVILEPCADYRQKICVESEIGNSGFKNSLCNEFC